MNVLFKIALFMIGWVICTMIIHIIGVNPLGIMLALIVSFLYWGLVAAMEER